MSIRKLTLLSESADVEQLSAGEEIDNENIEAELDEAMEDVPELTEQEQEAVDITNEYQVRVMKLGSKYFIEANDLISLATSRGYSIVESVEDVAEENNIDADEVVVIVEPQEELEEVLSEAKKATGKKARKGKKAVGVAAKVVKALKAKGIKVKTRRK